ncbi:MAG: carboxypeptidase regulatory-like domain-containing protein, partial [Bdellovibrionales bacterium]|nr:carboxypeptidase regulatory-like domain-containing protein [Bdellovibrionales bacterium]
MKFRFVELSVLIAAQIMLAGAARAEFQLAPARGNVTITQETSHFWKDLWDTLSGHRPRLSGDLLVVVKDSSTGLPIPGAQVMVGEARGVPFEGNTATTDGEGVAAFTHAVLREGKTVTVTASRDGYANLSVLNARGNRMEIGLVRQAPAAWAFLDGDVKGWPTGLDRKTLEVGFFLPGVRPETLLNFDPYQIVSSYRVEIDVYGKRLVPGNVVMPPQDKTYMIFPVHIEKPSYIMPVPTGFEAHLTAIAGNVPLGKAMDAMKEKDFLAVLNLTTLTHVTWTPRARVNGNMRNDLTLDIPLRQKAATASFANVPGKMDVVAISMADPSGDRGDFAPLDVKSIKSEAMKGGRGSVALALPAQQRQDDSHWVFAALFDRSQFIRRKGGRMA